MSGAPLCFRRAGRRFFAVSELGRVEHRHLHLRVHPAAHVHLLDAAEDQVRGRQDQGAVAQVSADGAAVVAAQGHMDVGADGPVLIMADDAGDGDQLQDLLPDDGVAVGNASIREAEGSRCPAPGE